MICYYILWYYNVYSIYKDSKKFHNKIVDYILILITKIYGIKIYTIQEVRDMPSNDMPLHGLVGQLIAFEFRNYDKIMVMHLNLH